jgi:hypothetical protein
MFAEELKVLAAFKEGGMLSPLLMTYPGCNHKIGTNPTTKSMIIPIAVSFLMIENLFGVHRNQFYAYNVYKNIGILNQPKHR